MNRTQEIDLIGIVENTMPFRKTSRGVMIVCPFHSDHEPSMYVTNDLAYCFACGKKLFPDQFVEYFTGRKLEDYDRSLYKSKRRDREYKAPDPKIAEIAHQILLSDNERMMYLLGRGITVDSVLKYKLGYFRPPLKKAVYPRFTFPSYDEHGNIQTISYRKDPALPLIDEYPEDRKYIIHPGTSVQLYCQNFVMNERHVLYVGGQIDAILANQIGIPAVGPLGEGTIKSEWISWLNSRYVYVLLDNDNAGKAAAKKILDNVSNSVAVFWPKEKPNKYDFNDALLDQSMGEHGIKKHLSDAVGEFWLRRRND